MKNNTTIELSSDKKMVESMRKFEEDIITKERIEQQNRKIAAKQYLDQQKDGDLSIEIGGDYLYGKEFELNKGLIKRISPNV